MKYKKF